MSKGGYIGYTYQEEVTFLFLAKMDTERDINMIESEATVEHKFDDTIVSCGQTTYCIQTKDIKGVSFEKLKFSSEGVTIDGKNHLFSQNVDILFFKQIDITPNTTILGLKAYEYSGVYLVSLSREGIYAELDKLYPNNLIRRNIIDTFFKKQLDGRIWKIRISDLPHVDVFDTRLTEDTIRVSIEWITDENLLLIEGKPGVGKSHLVALLEDCIPNTILYRFWISNQDAKKEERLKYDKLLSDFSRKLFDDYKYRDAETIIAKIEKEGKSVIIDGLDHVQNYNGADLQKVIDFIERLKEHCKVIVLSRPLENELGWHKQILDDWTSENTKFYLKEAHHITDNEVASNIYSISKGYPILVRYLAEHYKKNNAVPSISTLDTVDEYYNNIFENKRKKTASALSLFLCSNSYFMESEISLFLEGEASYVNEFIEDYPYLFDIRLNRIVLFHDSFTGFLRRHNIIYREKYDMVNQVVYDSVMTLEKRFLSRINGFGFSIEQKKALIKHFSSMEIFEHLMKGTIDIEAIQSFYTHLREMLDYLEPVDLSIYEYYDFSLIVNLLARNHIDSQYGFLYT
jgi:hypothetical protein